MNRLFASLVLTAFLLTGPLNAQQPGATAAATLKKYVQLRMDWAEWKDYSPFITWPDEPGWDCWWVARGYGMGKATQRGKKVVVPVTFSRVGRFCADFSLESTPKTDRIEFELVQQQGRWKIDGPDPDYPTISTAALRKFLSSEASKSTNRAERRAQAQHALEELSSIGTDKLR